MKYIKILLNIIVISMTVSSCMAAMDFGEPSTDSTPGIEEPNIIGSVSDTDNTPIEHIRVTLTWNNGEYIEIKYTSYDGTFISSGPIHGIGNNTLTVTLEDIDGERNGGLFESMTDTITLFEQEDGEYATVTLAYHLNRATASENIPQS